MADNKLTIAMTDMARKALNGDAVAAASACAVSIMETKTLTDDTSVAMLVDAAKKVRLGRLELEKQRDSIRDPLKEAVSAVNAIAQPSIDAMKDAETRAKMLKTAYDARVLEEHNRRVREEQARIDSERAAEAASTTVSVPSDEPPPAMSAYTPPPTTHVRAGVGSMTSRKVPKVRVTDVRAAFAAHPELFEIRAGAALRVLQDAAPNPVPGLELYYETTQVLS